MSELPPVAELLPHRGPAIVVDRVVAASPERATVEVTPPADVPATMALEYMAQAIGAWVGLRARARGEPIRIGFLLGTRELRLEVERFAAGERLEVDAEHLWGDTALGTFRCRVRRGEAALARADINVFQGDLEEVARR